MAFSLKSYCSLRKPMEFG